MKDMEKTIKLLQKKVDDPDPAIDFGTKGQQWSYEVFDLCATMLIERPTCNSAANMLEGILKKLYPPPNSFPTSRSFLMPPPLPLSPLSEDMGLLSFTLA